MMSYSQNDSFNTKQADVNYLNNIAFTILYTSEPQTRKAESGLNEFY
jgi:hypothetical protein